jgi:hypothetical protein
LNKFRIEAIFTTPLDAEDLFGNAVYVPEDAVITLVEPEFEAGWYQRSLAAGLGHVSHLDATDIRHYIEDYGLEEWKQNYVRVHPPVPYVAEVPRVRAYTDGYYYASNGSLYRRLDNKWSVRPADYNGPWIPSILDDSDIESDRSGIKFVPED